MAASQTLEKHPSTAAFPAPHLPAAGTFETVGAVFPVHVRYLPTRPCLKAVRERFGTRAEPLLMRWLDAWRSAVGDVDAFAATVRIEAAGPETPAEAPHYPDWPGPDFVRPASFHALEDASALVHALRTGAPFFLRVGARDRAVHFAVRPGTRRIGEAHRLVRVGTGEASPTLREAKTMFDQAWRATPYWSIPAFAARAGRGMAVARTADELARVLLAMSVQGHAQAFVKGTSVKSGTWVVDIPPQPDVERLGAALHDALGPAWSNFRRSGKSASFLVQGMTPFVREHRFFVVAHRVVASTASDRMLGALDANPSRILDERVARLDLPAGSAGYYDRGHSTSHVDRDLVARMARGARDLARALRASGTGMDCYVIDMGEATDGRVLPVEVNGLSRAGHYAVPFGRVLEAMRRRAGRMAGYDLPVSAHPAGDHARGSFRHIAPATSARVREVDANPGEDTPFMADFLAPRLKRRNHRKPGKASDDAMRFPADFDYVPGPDDFLGYYPDPYLEFLDPRRPPGTMDETWVDPDQEAPRVTPGMTRPGGPLRRRWLRYLATTVHGLCVRNATALEHDLARGDAFLAKRVVYSGRTLAEEVVSPGWARGWERWPSPGPFGVSGGWVVGLRLVRDDIDWATTLPAHGSIAYHQVTLAEGATPVIEWMTGRGLPEDSRVAPGTTVVVTPAACLAPPTHLRVPRGRAGPGREARIDEAFARYVEANAERVLEQVAKSCGDPEAWAGLGTTLRDRFEARAVRRAQDIEDAAARRVECIRGDAAGRVILVEAEDGGYEHTDSLRTLGEFGTRCLTVLLRDIDVDSTLEHAASKGPRYHGRPRVFLRPGARTWPFTCGHDGGTLLRRAVEEA